jgi:hypothetical protein
MKAYTLLCLGRKPFWILAIIAISAAPARSQTYAPAAPPARTSSKPATLRDLEAQINELRSLIVGMHNEVVRARAETATLRLELEETKTQFTPGHASSSETLSAVPPATAASIAADNPAATAPQSPEQRLTQLEDDQQILSDKIDDQYQTKMESASKYRVRFSGIVLTNLFSNRGSVENQDIPTWAEPRGTLDTRGSVGATLRQSELGFEVFGPDLAGAKTKADVQLDFAGGFSTAINGESAGIVRLRTAAFRMDWDATSLVAGQDTLFFSPLSPTSIASLAVPAFSYAGNLWTWTPQIRLEHRVGLPDGSHLTLQGGLLDPLTGDFPNNTFFRSPTAGEASRQPAYASRIAWSRPLFGQTFTVGAGGYYSRQNWGLDHTVDSWAGTADLLLPLGSRFELSGEFYRGRAVGGLGGGIGQSVVFSGNPTDPATLVRGIDSAGGWAQLKFRASSKLEFNGGFGEDSPSASQLSAFPAAIIYNGAALLRNQVSLGNFIYRPRSNLLFSLEYRHFRTDFFPPQLVSADHVNLSLGVLF